MSSELIVLRLVHIVGGVFWVGASMYLTFFQLPAVAEAGSAGGAVMAGLQRRRLFTVLPVVAITTILAGVRLLQVTSNGFAAAYFQSAMGQALLVASITTVIAFVIGFGVSRPAMLRAARLGVQRESSAPDRRLAIDVEVEALRAKGRVANLAVTLVLIVSTGLMAVARSL